MNLFKKMFLVLLIILTIPIYSYCDDQIDDNIDYINTMQTSSNTSSAVLSSKYALVLERNSNTILYEKNGFEKTAMASTTKIMTGILAIENASLEEIVRISKNAKSVTGSTLGINSTDQMKMEDLLYGLLLRSGNDCAVAIAEHISGSIENFSELMNQKAEFLNLKNTNFISPHGLDDPNHYTTAHDLAILTNYALKNPTFSKIVGTKNYYITLGKGSRQINNTNELLGYTEGVYGVKTGFTCNAGRCLVSSCKRNNLDIIVVVLGAGTKKQRTVDSINLINYIYSNFEMYDFTQTINNSFENFKSNSNTIKIENSNILPNLKLSKLKTYTLPIKKINTKNISSSIYCITNLYAPLEKDSKIGVLQIKVDDKPIITLDILLADKIKKFTIKEYFLKILKSIKYI